MYYIHWKLHQRTSQFLHLISIHILEALRVENIVYSVFQLFLLLLDFFPWIFLDFFLVLFLFILNFSYCYQFIREGLLLISSLNLSFSENAFSFNSWRVILLAIEFWIDRFFFRQNSKSSIPLPAGLHDFWGEILSHSVLYPFLCNMSFFSSFLQDCFFSLTFGF